MRHSMLPRRSLKRCSLAAQALKVTRWALLELNHSISSSTAAIPANFNPDKAIYHSPDLLPQTQQLPPPYRSAAFCGFILALSGAVLSRPVPAHAAGAYMYGIDATGNIIEYNPDIKMPARTIGSVGGSNGNGLAYDFNTATARERIWSYDSTRGLIYYDRNTDFTSGTIASNTVLQTLVGSTGSASLNFANAAYYDNSYWFVNFQSGFQRIVRVSFTFDASGAPTYAPYAATGVASSAWAWPSGFTTFGYGDIAITPAGMLYGATTSGQFYSLSLTGLANSDPTAPTAVPNANYTLIKNTGNPSLQLAFNSDYTQLYGVENTNGNWYTFDQTSPGIFNGNITQISGYSTPGIRDLGGSSASADVPSPLPLFGLGAAFHASRRLRRRIQAA